MAEVASRRTRRFGPASSTVGNRNAQWWEGRTVAPSDQALWMTGSGRLASSMYCCGMASLYLSGIMLAP